MGKETRSRAATIETHLAESLKKKLKAKVKKNNTSMSQVIRDFVQSYVKS